jgi:hypothetical protein
LPFRCLLTDPLIPELNAFARENSFPDLYRAYSWRNDTYANGFPDIYRLESRLVQSDRTNGITLNDVKAVAEWGSMRNQGRISGPTVVAPMNTLHTAAGVAVAALATYPLVPLTLIQAHLKGIGPTYLSKVLRFALPQEYGAIDTRCVRVFGRGDAGAHQHDWLPLHARNDGYGWYISKTQVHWPDAYEVWINILRHFAAVLPGDCPHPPVFAQGDLRQPGIWECADVEMALFSYASDHT